MAAGMTIGPAVEVGEMVTWTSLSGATMLIVS
jgi:hypothetical protein